MENYLDLINDFFKKRNNLICFDSYSNDVRLFKNHVVKTFISRERMEKCIVGLQIMSNTTLNVPTIQFICSEKNVIVENYIEGISLNEYDMHLTTRILYDVGKLMGDFHNMNVSSCNDGNTWIATILTDIIGIRKKLKSYEKDFRESINFVENESKKLFQNLNFTYVHGDFRPANIIFSQKEERYYLIDFENFMVGDPTLDLYKMLSVLKSTPKYNQKDVMAFLNGYACVRALPINLIDKWIFYDVYYSLRSVRRAINDNTFRNSDDMYIKNADQSAQMKNSRTIIMKKWLEEYINNLH